MTNTTLPTDSEARKAVPLLAGCLRYFPAALAGVARWSKLGNDKHNPGEPLHHARGKSMDHGDCILRHLSDIQDLVSAVERGPHKLDSQAILDEADALAWRACALSQELHERFGGAPLAPGAKLPVPPRCDLVQKADVTRFEEVVDSAQEPTKAEWLCSITRCMRPKNHLGECVF